MGRLRRRVNDQFNVAPVFLKYCFYGIAITNVRFKMTVLLSVFLLQQFPIPRGRSGFTEIKGAHVIVDADDLQALLSEEVNCL
jgi:hypothetical protein